MNPHEQALEERLFEAAYRQLKPHLEKYRLARSIDTRLPLMEPRLYSGFAGRACCDVAKLVMEAGRPPHRNHLPAAASGDELRDQLSECLIDFFIALENYTPVFQGFQQLYGRKPSPWLTSIVSKVFGGGDSGMDSDTQVAVIRLEGAFQFLLERYNLAMAWLVQAALQAVDAPKIVVRQPGANGGLLGSNESHK